MKPTGPVTLTPRAFAAIRYALTRQMTWLTNADRPFTIPACHEIYVRSFNARRLIDDARRAAARRAKPDVQTSNPKPKGPAQ